MPVTLVAGSAEFPKVVVPILILEEEFVKELAYSELNRLNVNIKEILVKHENNSIEVEEKTEKQLLQEDKKKCHK